MLKPETLLHNRYYIKRAIGQGGMGAVYEALDRKTKQTVAVKQTFFGDDERLDKAFRREAHILEHLQHPALPIVIEFFADEESKYLVMQFVPGDDLGMQLKAQDEPFDPATVLGWADQLLSVLGYLHSQEPPVIHRDIKPQNIKLTQSGDIILLDFGLAKGMAAQDGSTSTFTTIMGYTPSFASLEQRRGQATDARSDLYSLGATVYQLLTNITPIDAMERAADLGMNRMDPLPPIKELNPRIPGAVAEVLMQALKLNPAERPASAAVMRAALLRAWQSSQKRAEEKTVIEPRTETEIESAAEKNTSPAQGRTLRNRRTDEMIDDETARPLPLAEPPVTDATRVQKAKRRSPYKVWSVILGFGFVAIIAGSYFWSTSLKSSMSERSATMPTSASSPRPPNSPSPQPSSDSSSGTRVEYLRYYLEAKSTTGKITRNGLDTLPRGRFKFHFRSQMQGFLYIIALDEGGNPAALLTNSVSKGTSVSSNKLTPNSDFTFPVSGWIDISKSPEPVRYTVIFATSLIKELKFLDDQPLRPLTADEQAALKSFQARYQTSALETKRQAEFATVTAQTGRTEPLIFDIAVNPR